MGAIEIRSPLPIEECVARLRAATDPKGFETFCFGSRPVVNEGSGRLVRLRRQYQVLPRSDFHLVGDLSERGEGTLFRGGDDRGERADWRARLLITTGVCAANLAIGYARGTAQLRPGWSLVLGGWVLIVAPLFAVIDLWSRRCACRDEAYLIAFLGETLGAKPTPPDLE